MRLIAMIGKAEVWAEQDAIRIFPNSDEKVLEMHPLSLVYAIQEYQKHFTLRAPVDTSSWRGWVGTNE
jgi:hypothetical protein